MASESSEPVPLADFDFPLVVTLDQILDIELTRKLPLQLFLRHEGYSFTISGKRFSLRIRDSADTSSDSLVLDVSSFRGVTSAASHYYGVLELPTIDVYRANGKPIVCGTNGSPRFLRKVQLTRSVTQFDLDAYPDRFLGFPLGGPTQGFDNEATLLDRARNISSTYFPGFRLLTPGYE